MEISFSHCIILHQNVKNSSFQISIALKTFKVIEKSYLP